MENNPCSLCSLPKSSSRCAACQFTIYCSARCQQLHWTFHQLECGRQEEPHYFRQPPLRLEEAEVLQCERNGVPWGSQKLNKEELKKINLDESRRKLAIRNNTLVNIRSLILENLGHRVPSMPVPPRKMIPYYSLVWANTESGFVPYPGAPGGKVVQVRTTILHPSFCQEIFRHEILLLMDAATFPEKEEKIVECQNRLVKQVEALGTLGTNITNYSKILEVILSGRGIDRFYVFRPHSININNVDNENGTSGTTAGDASRL